MKVIVLLSLTLVSCLPALLAASPFVGTFKGKDGVIRILERGPGQFAGEFVASGQSLPFTALEKEGALIGQFAMEDEEVDFRMVVKGATLTLSIEEETSKYTREKVVTDAPLVRPGGANPATPPKTLRVNGVTISDRTLKKLEQDQGLHLPRGDFWYDRVSGAWGVAGGPTLGFTTPGINLGGPLRRDASKGDSGVFINNRELPLQDVAGLQQLNVPVQRGRWWVDSLGNFGREGSPAGVGNLFQFSQGKGGAYQRATAGGYIGSDGQTSYFFDPKTGSSVLLGN